jgi:hypothetical protein
VSQSFCGMRGQCGDILVLIDKKYIVVGQIKAAEEVFAQWAGADNIDSITLQQPVKVTEQYRVAGSEC